MRRMDGWVVQHGAGTSYSPVETEFDDLIWQEVMGFILISNKLKKN